MHNKTVVKQKDRFFIFISFLANESQEKTDANYKNANEVLGDYINNKIGLISTCKPDSVTSPAYKDYIAL